MEGHDPIISWEFAISICPQPLSIAEMTTKEKSSPKDCWRLIRASDDNSSTEGLGEEAQRHAETRRSGRQRDREMQAARDGETEILGRRRQQAIGRPSDTGRIKKFRL